MLANATAITTIGHETFLLFLSNFSISLAPRLCIKLRQSQAEGGIKYNRQEGQAYHERELFPKMRVQEYHSSPRNKRSN